MFFNTSNCCKKLQLSLRKPKNNLTNLILCKAGVCLLNVINLKIELTLLVEVCQLTKELVVEAPGVAMANTLLRCKNSCLSIFIIATATYYSAEEASTHLATSKSFLMSMLGDIPESFLKHLLVELLLYQLKLKKPSTLNERFTMLRTMAEQPSRSGGSRASQYNADASVRRFNAGYASASNVFSWPASCC